MGIFMNLIRGFIPGAIIYIITFAVMTIFLPYGALDGTFQGLISFVLLISYFGDNMIGLSNDQS